ncbi:MAG: hypothetical protein JNM00_09645, partial [Flavobacteriales bacterium]|nr:hypothetical protein [Flavobacteriales bacterium]
GWKVFPYEPIDEVERWSGYYKSTTHPTIILGSPLEAGNGLHHIYCGAYGSLQAEWTQRIRFRSCSRLD